MLTGVVRAHRAPSGSAPSSVDEIDAIGKAFLFICFFGKINFIQRKYKTKKVGPEKLNSNERELLHCSTPAAFRAEDDSCEHISLLFNFFQILTPLFLHLF